MKLGKNASRPCASCMGKGTAACCEKKPRPALQSRSERTHLGECRRSAAQRSESGSRNAGSYAKTADRRQVQTRSQSSRAARYLPGTAISRTNGAYRCRRQPRTNGTYRSTPTAARMVPIGMVRSDRQEFRKSDMVIQTE